MSGDFEDFEELYGEAYGVAHRNGSITVRLPVRRASAAGTRYRVPLWRAVLRYWCGALILATFAWWNALGRGGHVGGPSAEPLAWLIPLVTVVGGLAALGTSWLSGLIVRDRRVLFSAWSACGAVAGVTALLRPGLFGGGTLTGATLASAVGIFGSFLISLLVLRHAGR